MATGLEGVRALAAKIRKLGDSNWKYEVNSALAEATLNLIAEEFTEKVDPYSQSWKPTKQPNPILVKTGALQDSFKPTVTQNGFKVTSNIPYFKFHQYGTKTINVRKMLPNQNTGLPRKWADTYKAVLATFIDKALT